MNDQERDAKPSGRVVNVTAFGDTASEIELDALDKARAFFGSDLVLEIIRDYQVHSTSADNAHAGGKKYWAAIGVRAVN